MPSSLARRIGLIGVIGLIFIAPARAADSQLWGALLLGTNQPTSETPPAELAPYQKRLSKVFGYAAFQVLGKSTRAFSDNSEQWLIPGKTFSVRSVVQPSGDNYQVDLQLFQDKKELVQTEAKLGPDSPLFIRGPLYGKGQLIIVIMVRDDR